MGGYSSFPDDSNLYQGEERKRKKKTLHPNQSEYMVLSIPPKCLWLPQHVTSNHLKMTVLVSIVYDITG